jgi:tRNA nucleotidyltransferase (CCA-adding enzyme)
MKCANPAAARAAFKSALKKIKPSEAEGRRDFEAAGQLIRKLERVLPPAVEVRLAGSLAKGTDLRGKNEFDIFLLFPRHYSHHEMTLLGLSHARRAFAGMRVESRYAEHPYLQVFSGDYHADIVPAYKISGIGEKGSSVDRSPLHTQYVNSRLDSSGKDDVRLLKRFMKNFGIYGAELRVEGFSGYLCELLVIKYGSLLSLMEAAAEWHQPSLVLEGGVREGEARKRFGSPLVVIDPVDPERNVAAVVAQTSLSRFVFECRRFLKAPSEKFFFAEKTARSADEIRGRIAKRGTLCLAVSFPAPKAVPDVLWPQLKKTAQALVRRLQEQDFGVFGYYHWSDGAECVVLLELDRWELPPVRKALGPSIRFSADVEAFVKKHSDALNIHLEHDRMVAVEKRGVLSAEKALAAACRNPKGLGVPAGMEGQLARAKVVPATKIATSTHLEFLSDYFFAKIA